MTPKPLDPSQLYRRCDPESLGFRTTEELGELDRVLGQERAVAALEFGAGIKRFGYNLFALGPPGVGKHSVIADFLKRRAGQEPVPSDWCYVNSFAEPQKPRALELPAGRATPLEEDMRRLVDELKVAIPAAFESEDYRSRSRLIEEELKERQE
ncbi:MAG: Lon-like protease helical domain-containing protein, partial [Geminicoccales bacterium]